MSKLTVDELSDLVIWSSLGPTFFRAFKEDLEANQWKLGFIFDKFRWIAVNGTTEGAQKGRYTMYKLRCRYSSSYRRNPLRPQNMKFLWMILDEMSEMRLKYPSTPIRLELFTRPFQRNGELRRESESKWNEHVNSYFAKNT